MPHRQFVLTVPKILRGTFRKRRDPIHLLFKDRITSGSIETIKNQIARLIHTDCGTTNLRNLFLKTRVQSLNQIRRRANKHLKNAA